MKKMGMGVMAKAYKSNKGKMWTGTSGEKMMGSAITGGSGLMKKKR
jgi:hypothetical protein